MQHQITGGTRTGCFIFGRDGAMAWQTSGIVESLRAKRLCLFYQAAWSKVGEYYMSERTGDGQRVESKTVSWACPHKLFPKQSVATRGSYVSCSNYP